MCAFATCVSGNLLSHSGGSGTFLLKVRPILSFSESLCSLSLLLSLPRIIISPTLLSPCRSKAVCVCASVITCMKARLHYVTSNFHSIKITAVLLSIMISEGSLSQANVSHPKQDLKHTRSLSLIHSFVHIIT